MLNTEIRRLLEQAADEVEETGHAYLDTQARLDAEGYLLSALDRDVARIIRTRL